MKNTTHAKWLRRKRRINKRLRVRKFKARLRPMLTARNIHYDMSDRDRAIACGGIGSIHLLARKTGLIDAIDRDLNLLKVHLPYHESDHVLNIAYNILAGGDCLQDLELLRNDQAWLDALGASRIPDPTTAGDFCRRFESADQVNTLMDAINSVRAGVWKSQPDAFFEQAIIDADGTLAATDACCKEGFLFGIDAMPHLKMLAELLEKSAWKKLERPPRYEVKTEERAKPDNVREKMVQDRDYKNLRLRAEHVAEIDYQPGKCHKSYCLIICRKTIDTEIGGEKLWDDYRYFFYITNDRLTPAHELVLQANGRCDQENLIEQLKNGVKAMKLPVDTLLSNWAYMVMASLAWSLKAWWGLMLPEENRPGRSAPAKEARAKQKHDVVRMEFKRFVASVIRLPCQIIKSGRKLIYRMLSYSPWQEPLLAGVAAWRTRTQC